MTGDENGEFEVFVEEHINYVDIGRPRDVKSIGKYETRKRAIQVGLIFQIYHLNYGFCVCFRGQEVVCQKSPLKR